MRVWLREVTREPSCRVDGRGVLVCSYCGARLCVPVPGLDLVRVACGHYATAWREHAAVTKGRARL